MTLFQTIAFAEFERAKPEFAVLEHDGGKLNAVRFNVGVERLEAPTLGKASDSYNSSRYADILRQTTDLFIPTGQSFKETQISLDLLYKGSSYEGIKFVDKGLAWTSEGYNFYFHESGHLHVSRNSKVAEANRNLRFFNAHGAVFLSDDMDFESLALDAKDVVQTGTVRAKKLITKIAGRYSLEGHLTVSELLFEGNHTLGGVYSPVPTFVNTKKGTLEGINLTIKGKAVFQNEGDFKGGGTTTLALDGVITNNGTMELAGVMVERGILVNTGTFGSEVIEGSFKTLVNKGTVSLQKFKDLSIETLINYESGTIKGDGHLILSGKDPLTEKDKPVINQGKVESNSLSLTLNCDFTNEGTLSSEVRFDTNGTGTFYQKGTLNAKVALLDNTHIFHSGTINCADSDVTLGQNVASFITTKKSTVTAGNLVNHSALLNNAGAINLSSWDQGKGHVYNQAGAKITVENNTTLNSDLIQNKGELTFKGTFGGHVDTFTNQGTLNTHGITALTGDKFLNHSVMRSHDKFTFNGRSFTSNEKSDIEASQPMSITTISPLDLKGTLILKKSGSFTAPTIENHGTMQSESGKTTFNGVLTNHHYLNVDELAYDQKTLINNGKLYANRITSTTLMDHITNAGTLISRAGGFKTKRTINNGSLALESGDAELASATLSLGLGRYELGVLENTAGSRFQTETGMNATVTDIINDGEIVTKTSLILDSLKGMTKLGVVKAAEDLILKSTYIPKEVDWMDEFLWANKQNFHLGRKLIVEIERFVNRQQFTRAWDLPLSDVKPYDSIPYHLEFRTDDFVNNGTLTTRGLTIRSKTFKNGHDNDHMGTIHVYGPMDIEVERDVDNRFGEILASEDGHVFSRNGKINNGEAIVNGNSKTRNGAKIVANGALFMEANQNIDNDFGLLYGGTEVSLKTQTIISNKTALILSSGQIYLEAEELMSVAGTLWKTGLTFVDPGPCITPYERVCLYAYDEYIDSLGSEIKTAQGNIYINVKNGINKGSIIHTPDGIYINGKKFNENDLLPSSFTNESEDLYKRYQCKVINSNGTILRDYSNISHRRDYVREALPGLIQSGKAINISTDLFTLSGDINAPNVTLNADVLEVIRPHLTVCPKTGNFILNGASIFRELTQNNSFFVDHNGTNQAKLLGLEDHAVPRSMPTLNPRGTTVPRFSKIAMQHLCSYLFGTYLGTLNVYGRSGYPLIEHLYKQGEPFVNQVISLKNTSMSNYAMADILEHCAENANHGCIFSDEQGNPHFLITQDMILDIALQYATISASNLKINIKDKSKLDGSVFAAYNPYDPSTEKTEDTSRSAFERAKDKTVGESKTKEEHQAPQATSDINLGYVDAVAAKFL